MQATRWDNVAVLKSVVTCIKEGYFADSYENLAAQEFGGTHSYLMIDDIYSENPADVSPADIMVNYPSKY